MIKPVAEAPAAAEVNAATADPVTVGRGQMQGFRFGSNLCGVTEAMFT